MLYEHYPVLIRNRNYEYSELVYEIVECGFYRLFKAVFKPGGFENGQFFNLAAKHGSLEIFQDLLAYEVYPERSLTVAFSIAIENGQDEIVEYLLGRQGQLGVDISSLEKAVQKGYSSTIKLIVSPDILEGTQSIAFQVLMTRACQLDQGAILLYLIRPRSRLLVTKTVLEQLLRIALNRNSYDCIQILKSFQDK